VTGVQTCALPIYPLVAMQARGYADITPQGQTSMNTSGADCGCRNFGAAPCGYPPALSAVRVSEGAARLGEDWSPPADLNPSPLTWKGPQSASHIPDTCWVDPRTPVMRRLPIAISRAVRPGVASPDDRRPIDELLSPPYLQPRPADVPLLDPSRCPPEWRRTEYVTLSDGEYECVRAAHAFARQRTVAWADSMAQSEPFMFNGFANAGRFGLEWNARYEEFFLIFLHPDCIGRLRDVGLLYRVMGSTAGNFDGTVYIDGIGSFDNPIYLLGHHAPARGSYPLFVCAP